MQVAVVSGNTAAGTISASPINIPGGFDSASTSFQPQAQGSTTITASSPNFASAQVSATVTSQKVPTPAPVTVGQFLQDQTAILLPSPAGAGGVNVTVTSNSPSVKLTTNPNAAGASSIVITIPANQQSATLYVQSLANTGSATYTVSTASFGTAVGTVQFAPSAVVLFPQSVSGPLSSGSINSVSVFTALLDDSNTPVTQQSLAGGSALNVAVSSTNTAVASVPTTVSYRPRIPHDDVAHNVERNWNSYRFGFATQRLDNSELLDDDVRQRLLTGTGLTLRLKTEKSTLLLRPF